MLPRRCGQQATLLDWPDVETYDDLLRWLTDSAEGITFVAGFDDPTAMGKLEAIKTARL